MKILGVMSDISEDELKKRYRELIRMTHPDEVKSHDYPYEIHDINRAYEYLLSHLMDEHRKQVYKEKKKTHWNAPMNPNAYCERPIYQYYQDEEGSNIGIVTIDNGKFLWMPDEDFSLFLKSLYVTSKQIIEEDDAVKGCSRVDDVSLLSNITYLLAGQFFGAEVALSLMKKDSEQNAFYTKAMLELDITAMAPKDGDVLVPTQVKNHRLYVSDVRGRQLGYLSFKDDRLLFGLIPLFERRVVSVKMKSCKTIPRAKSVDVDMWIKLLPENESVIDSVNLKIANLLRNE